MGLEILRVAHDIQPGQHHVKRVVCEMGGKNAIIVDEDADLDEAVVHIIESAFGYQGQKCSACSRLILVEEIHDLLLERLVEAVKSLKIGPTEDPRNFIGPVIDADAQARITSYLQLGRREGKCLLTREAPDDGFFIGPAIFSEIQPYHRLATDEIFGPVLPVLEYRTLEEAIHYVNARPHPLAMYYFDDDRSRALDVMQRISAGGVTVNDCIYHAGHPNLPFGGVGRIEPRQCAVGDAAALGR